MICITQCAHAKLSDCYLPYASTDEHKRRYMYVHNPREGLSVNMSCPWRAEMSTRYFDKVRGTGTLFSSPTKA